MARIEQRPDRYLRSPRLSAHHAGGATVYLVSWEPEGERITAFALNRCGSPTGPMAEGPLLERLVALEGRDPPRPSEDPGAELRAEDGEWRVQVEHGGGDSSIYLWRQPPIPRRTPRELEAAEQAGRRGPRRLIRRVRGMVAAPALARTPEGCWIAYHHDVREDTGAQDVAKWIALLFVDMQGRLFEPLAPMRDRDRDRHGEEQSFEFPALLAFPDGSLSLFGRGSHNFWRQDLGAEGFGPRLPLSDGVWGSRGRRPSACRLVDGGALVAFREGKGIDIHRLEAPGLGRPELRALEAPAPGGMERGAESGRQEAREAREARDPARRHGLRTFFGDIQQHSAHSDGLGSADEAYLRARWRYEDDFVALTDHESFLGKRTSPGEWAYLQAVADRHEEAGAFATLIAYEWTGRRHPGPGHKCVYLPRAGLPLLSRDDYPRGADLVAAIKELGGFAAPHHIGWTGCDEEGHDPEGQPVWEICSCHGCYEHADHPLGQRGDHRDQMVDVMLRRGHRFGFTAASDSHGLLWHHGESRKRDPYRTGLTAVQAPTLSREAIFEGIRAGRCYATSGAKILLDFTVDGAPMGSTLEARRSPLARVEAAGTGEIERLELIGESGILGASTPAGDHGVLEARASGPWVYARVIQRDGEMAWASPVFLGGPGGSSP